MTRSAPQLFASQFSQGVVSLKQSLVNLARFTARGADVVDGHTLSGIVNDGPRWAKRLIVRVSKGYQEASRTIGFSEDYRFHIPSPALTGSDRISPVSLLTNASSSSLRQASAGRVEAVQADTLS